MQKYVDAEEVIVGCQASINEANRTIDEILAHTSEYRDMSAERLAWAYSRRQEAEDTILRVRALQQVES